VFVGVDCEVDAFGDLKVCWVVVGRLECFGDCVGLLDEVVDCRGV